MRIQPTGSAPATPFPDPLSPVLDLLVRHVVAEVRRSAAPLEDAVRLAVVSGWYEGHIEGEDSCHGCDYRGDDPAYATSMRYYAG